MDSIIFSSVKSLEVIFPKGKKIENLYTKLMKNFLPRSEGIIILLFLLTVSGELFSQSAGTFSFSVNTTAPSTANYGTDNLLAVWIQNGAAAFIKTKIKYCKNGDLSHLDTWVAKSGQNTVDAITGASRTSYGTVTFLWNGTNVAGTVVPDGSYFVWLEMAWDDNDKTLNSFPFTKGTNAFHSNPANTANFLSIVLDWTPLSTEIEGTMESKDINVYPNPSSGRLNIDFKHPEKECLVQVINESGRIEYNEKISDIQTGIRTLDLSSLPGGIYCTLHFPGKDVVFSILLVK
jgi:hypothetical protein